MKVQSARPVSLAFLVVASAVLVSSIGRADDPTAKALQRREGTVKANGITLAYEDYGPEDREAVLLIMGNGTQLTAWPIELIDDVVRRGYRVVIYDNRDVGLSTKFAKAEVPDVKAVIEAQIAGKPSPL